jgi:predicted CopG family antitoxin
MKALTISIQDSTYQELKRVTGQRQVSQFINKLITEELAKEKQKLIADYKDAARDEDLRAEDEI